MFRSAMGHHQGMKQSNTALNQTSQFVQESIVVRQFLPNLSTLLTFVKYVGCFQDTVHQYLSRLFNNSTKKRQHFKHLSL